MTDLWDAQREVLGAFIRDQRKKANLSLRQLAELTSLSNPYLSQVERGLHQPSVRVLRAISDALKTWVETVQSVTQSLPSIPSISLPGADRLPNPHEVVARGYDFAEQFLTSQRKFADEVVKAAAPLLPGNGSSK